MARVEVNFSNGALRQPGMWVKVLHPDTGSINEVGLEQGVEWDVNKQTRTLTVPNLADNKVMIIGVRGYHGAGKLVSFYVLLKVRESAALDLQYSGHLARFEGKGVELVEKADETLAPIYQALPRAGYKEVDRLKDILQKEGIDRTGK